MAISFSRTNVGRVRLRWAATILLTGCALAAAGIWAPDVVARKTDPARETPVRKIEVAAPAREPDPEPEPSTVHEELAQAGEVPASGPGSFVGATEGGPLLGGDSGRFKRVRVAVESNLTAELDGLVAAVDEILGDPRSWVAGGAYRFQRVPWTAAHDFTIYLVTRETAYRMCRVNGVDIRVDGVPYTSCRQVGKVIINLDRWRLSVPPYVDNQVPLKQYRAYVLNHEVGHELGRGHVGCPTPGGPAPVMLTQTLGLQGCTPNPWPHP